MSAPIVLSISAAALALALPIIGAAGVVEAQHRVSGAADNAALAAADALVGLIDAEPCALAASVAEIAATRLDRCEIQEATLAVFVQISAPTPLVRVSSISRAGQFVSYSDGAEG